MSFIQPVDNPCFSIANRPIAVARDTAYVLSNSMPPTSGGSADPNQTDFQLTNSAQSPFHFENSALSVTLTFAATSGLAATLPAICTPPWNLFGRLIRAITFDLNNKGTPMVSSSSSNYVHEWTAYMLQKYDWDALNNHPAVLGPVAAEADEYIGSSGAGAPAAGTSANTRFKRYVGAAADPANNDSHLKQIKLICPLTDLFLGMPGIVLKNLREFIMTITWEDRGVVLESTDPGTSRGYVYIRKVELLSSHPVKTPSQMSDTTVEKSQGAPDIIAWSYPTAEVRGYSSSSTIIVNGKKNLDKIFIYQPTHLVGSNRATRAATSSGQFELVRKATTVTVGPFFSDSTIQGLDTIAIQYGSITYPSDPIVIGNGANGNNGEQLYLEYQKACDVLAAKDVSPIPHYIFRRTMPFVMFKMSSSEAATLDQSGKDVLINMRGTGVAGASVVVVCFQTKIFKLEADGSTTVIST